MMQVPPTSRLLTVFILRIRERRERSALLAGALSSLIAGRLLLRACSIVALSSMACTAPPPSVPVASPTIALYYVESWNGEPWSAHPNGSAPPQWESHFRSDLASADLHPISVERKRFVTGPLDVAQPCRWCANGFALVVVLPSNERDAALARCFETDPPNFRADVRLASKRTDCAPLHRSQ